MTIDLNKVNQFVVKPLYTVDLDDGETVQTLEEATLEAQRDTDCHGRRQGIFKLVAYTEQGPPKATVTVI